MGNVHASSAVPGTTSHVWRRERLDPLDATPDIGEGRSLTNSIHVPGIGAELRHPHCLLDAFKTSKDVRKLRSLFLHTHRLRVRSHERVRGRLVGDGIVKRVVEYVSYQRSPGSSGHSLVCHVTRSFFLLVLFGSVIDRCGENVSSRSEEHHIAPLSTYDTRLGVFRQQPRQESPNGIHLLQAV